MKLINRVKSLRSSNGWTQEQFAQMIGVTRQTIISLEKGSYTPSLLLAMQIARVFALPVESIFYLEEESE